MSGEDRNGDKYHRAAHDGDSIGYHSGYTSCLTFFLFIVFPGCTVRANHSRRSRSYLRRRHAYDSCRPTTSEVRLAEIDAPESHQDYGQRAKQALGNLVFGREVSVDNGGKDRYDRTIGHVRLGRQDLNAEMVRTGYAWCIASTPRIRACMRSKMKHERRGEAGGRVIIRCRRGSGGRREESVCVAQTLKEICAHGSFARK